MDAINVHLVMECGILNMTIHIKKKIVLGVISIINNLLSTQSLLWQVNVALLLKKLRQHQIILISIPS